MYYFNFDDNYELKIVRTYDLVYAYDKNCRYIFYICTLNSKTVSLTFNKSLYFTA